MTYIEVCSRRFKNILESVTVSSNHRQVQTQACVVPALTSHAQLTHAPLHQWIHTDNNSTINNVMSIMSSLRGNVVWDNEFALRSPTSLAPKRSVDTPQNSATMAQKIQSTRALREYLMDAFQRDTCIITSFMEVYSLAVSVSKCLISGYYRCW